MVRCLVLLLATVGCRQVFGLDQPVAVVDANGESLDAPPDSSPRDCRGKWMNNPRFDPPIPVSELNTGEYESDPTLTADGLTIYLQRKNDIYMATRPSVGSSWSEPTPVTSLNSMNADVKLTLASDGLSGFLSSNRGATVGGVDIWRVFRSDETAPWEVDQEYLGVVNTETDQHDPFISHDQLSLYFAHTDVSGQHLRVAGRSSAESDFETVALVLDLDGAGHEADPMLTADEQVFLFTSTATGTRRIMYAVRSTVSGPFAPPVELEDLNAGIGLGDSDVHLSADACTVYFSSQRSGMGDIYMATLQ